MTSRPAGWYNRRRAKILHRSTTWGSAQLHRTTTWTSAPPLILPILKIFLDIAGPLLYNRRPAYFFIVALLLGRSFRSCAKVGPNANGNENDSHSRRAVWAQSNASFVNSGPSRFFALVKPRAARFCQARRTRAPAHSPSAVQSLVSRSSRPARLLLKSTVSQPPREITRSFNSVISS